jgi:hypothetical protein
MAGTAKYGGVIAIAGDDHISKAVRCRTSDHIFGHAVRRCSS